uniref:Protocadherin 10a n=1 Tax=Sinocyclocheilus anshuiensis TaxID=1608454 RepID=A0A671KFQ3_9TELE
MILIFLFFSILDGGLSQLHFSVPEEQERGSVVGNIAEDLGLDITKLSARRFQTVPSSRTPYLEVNLENGALVVNERIDREEICRQTVPCLLHLEVFLENPLELFRVEIEVMDINDNPPSFPETDITVEITESATPGTRFPVENAFDPDVGTNALSTYAITTNNYFYLDVQTQGDGNRFAELVLDKPLDREQQAVHRYVLTAVDGGQPQKTGTALLVVKVLDSNDNAPTFDQSVYSVSLRENSPVGTLVIQLNVRDHGQPPLSSSASINVVLVDSIVEGRSGDRGSVKSKEGSLDLTLILIIALGSVSFIFLLAMIVLAVRCQKDKKLNIYTCMAGDLCCQCCSRQARGRKKKLSKSDIMLVQSTNVASTAQVPVEESGSFGSHHQNQNYCYQVCLTPESAKTDLMFLKPCSPSRSTDTEHNPCGAIVTGYADQQPDIISNGSILSSETKHQRTELSYLVDRPRRVNSSAFQEADIVSSKDSGHGDSEQGDSDHDATNRGHTAGADLFSNCTEECKALGHSDRCWMPSFMPGDNRQGADYRSNLHVPGMDAVPDTEVQESVVPGDACNRANDRSFSTFGKDKSHHGTLTRHELHTLLPSARAPYKPNYLCEYSLKMYDF